MGTPLRKFYKYCEEIELELDEIIKSDEIHMPH
jgi:hypothetical protein